MSFCTKVYLLFFAAISVYIGIQINSLLRVPPLPELENTWWGIGEETKESTSVKPFKINIGDKVLIDLKNRLDQARPFTPPLEGIQQQYGMNTNLLKEIVEFWKTKYDWREREQFLNQHPQFTTIIQGLDIHFIRVKPTAAPNIRVLPILLMHGYPGSVRELYEIIPLLTKPQKDKDFVFEVIVPSLPGYGFSQGAAKPGLGPAQMAVIFKNLMERLGFAQYYLHGDDWGSLIASSMATLYPEKVLGMHANVCVVFTPLAILKTLLGSIYPAFVVEKRAEKYMYPLSDIISFNLLESGYVHIQTTKPDTVGVALTDSPVGLAAYILEKFTTWTNRDWRNRADGGLKLKYSYTDLLDNVMIYWVTGSITTAMRIYSEYFCPAHFNLGLERIPIEVPTACSRFPHEIIYQSDSILRDKYKSLVEVEEMARGGHFPDFEEPQLLAGEIWDAVGKFREIHNTT